jgi:hypothetical protein
VIHRISVRARRTLKLADLSEVEALGVDKERYGELSYERTQAIGDAAYFLGFDGMMVPSARWRCHNLILFTDQLSPEDLASEKSMVVDWDVWRREADALRRRSKT